MFNRKRIDNEYVEDIKLTYEFHYSKILDTLQVNTTNRLRDIENVKFMEFFNVSKFKEYENNFLNFLFRLSSLSL